MFHHQVISLGLSFTFTLIPFSQASAQLLPDNTLGQENSVVNSINSLEDVINGGAIRGSNLFHSFFEFNIDSGRTVYFNNPTAIKNILTRVTGNNQSQILGKLGVLGNANLFLINPKGIIFGKDATLDINGSFVGSTASFIDFADGTEFSAVSPEDKPLLTISTPLGLGMGNNPGEIRVQGDGHKIFNSGISSPFKDNNTKALELAKGKTIALIGGNIILEGGSLKTNSGIIELGSVGSGQIDFSITPQNLEFNYDRAQTFQDIQLLKESSIQANSVYLNKSIENNLIHAGSIRLQGKQISIKNGSIILINNQGYLPAGSININATESVEISGSNLTESNFSSLRTQAFLTGKGSDIKINTKSLFQQDGSTISAYNFGSNSGGDIEIKASDSIELNGISKIRNIPNFIVNNTFSSGNGGNINILSSRLILKDGSTIGSSNFGKGHAGNLTIDTSESVEVIGTIVNSFKESVLTSLTLGNGNGGNLTLNTKKLTVKDGGRVDASTVSSGKAGSITINASEGVDLIGYSPYLSIPSKITSSADITDKSVQQQFGLPEILSGESGKITLNTNQLNIAKRASLAVKNDGSGNAGILTIKANSININNQGSINAATKTGQGGDINLQTHNLLLRGNSNISATSGGNGNGGNITIDTQVLTALENSDITANSEGSFGGRVVINAKGIFGTQFREFLTPESDITATSGLGTEFNGVVDINAIKITPKTRLIELSNNLTDSSEKIVSRCTASQDNNFIIIGRGGNPENPNQLFSGNSSIVDLVDMVSTSENPKYSVSSKDSADSNQPEIIEAQGWIVNGEGKIEFVAEVPEVTPNSRGIGTVDCQPS